MLVKNVKSAVLKKPSFEKVIVVTKLTQLDALLARFNTAAQARFYLEHTGEDFDPIEIAHQQYYRIVDQVRGLIPRGVKSILLERDLLPQYQFEENDLVIVIGPDGLVVNAAKYLSNQPILAVNPEPQSFDGILLPYNIFTIKKGLDNALFGEIKVKNIAMAEAHLADGQQLLAFNDLFVGANSHVSARYEIRMGQQH